MEKNTVSLSDAAAKALGITQEPGWSNPFTRQQAPQARFPNGSRISKYKSETGDITLAGTQGTVLGSLYHPTLGFGYFVEWDDKPRCAVFVVGWKIGVSQT